MELPSGFNSWTQIMKDVELRTPDIKDDHILMFRNIQHIQFDEMPIESEIRISYKQLKLLVFDELRHIIKLDINTYVQLANMPCSQDNKVREFISNLNILVGL